MPDFCPVTSTSPDNSRFLKGCPVLFLLHPGILRGIRCSELSTSRSNCYYKYLHPPCIILPYIFDPVSSYFPQKCFRYRLVIWQLYGVFSCCHIFQFFFKWRQRRTGRHKIDMRFMSGIRKKYPLLLKHRVSPF